MSVENLSRSILVVDDDRSVRTSTVRLLLVHGYAAAEAANASDALQRTKELSPDAILMDLHLRQGNGLDAARQIKAQPALAHIPIIALTATPPTWDEQLELFAAVLVKPCPASEILEAVEAALLR